jgi:hypothetical protein
MRMWAALVKRLAQTKGLWHWPIVPKPDNKSREERLAEALRANLRRRKVSGRDTKPGKMGGANCPKSAD